jgi:hypothetical protein
MTRRLQRHDYLLPVVSKPTAVTDLAATPQCAAGYGEPRPQPWIHSTAEGGTLRAWKGMCIHRESGSESSSRDSGMARRGIRLPVWCTSLPESDPGP